MPDPYSSFIRRFFRVWMDPRGVMRDILATQPGYHVWTLIVLYALLQAFLPQYYAFFAGREDLSLLLSIGILLSIAFDVAVFFLFTGFWYWAGKLLGGKGSWKDVQTAYAWCYPPALVGTFLLQLGGIPVWLKMISGEINTLALLTLPRQGWQILLEALSFLLNLWAVVWLVPNLAEAHRFSILRALALLLMLLIPFVVLAVVGAVYVVIHFGPLFHAAMPAAV